MSISFHFKLWEPFCNLFVIKLFLLIQASNFSSQRNVVYDDFIWYQISRKYKGNDVEIVATTENQYRVRQTHCGPQTYFPPSGRPDTQKVDENIK